MLKFSDLKLPTARNGYSPKQKIELTEFTKPENPEALQQWLTKYWDIPDMKSTETSAVLNVKEKELKVEKVDQEDVFGFYEIPGSKKSGESVKMIKFLDATGNMKNVLLNVFLKKVDPKTVSEITYYEV